MNTDFPVLSSPHWNHVHSRKKQADSIYYFYIYALIYNSNYRYCYFEARILRGRKYMKNCWWREREKTYLHFNLNCIIWSLLVCEAIVINHGEAVFTSEQRFHVQCRKGIPGNPLVPSSVVLAAWLWPLNHLQVRKKNRNCGKKDIKK